jgi:hypothetical protein
MLSITLLYQAFKVADERSRRALRSCHSSTAPAAVHLAVRTIPRFHPVQQTRIAAGRRTIAEGRQLLGRRRPAALLTDASGSAVSKFHPSASQLTSKANRQDEALRARQRRWVEIGIDHGRVTHREGYCPRKGRVWSESTHASGGMSGKAWTLPTPSRAVVDLSEMAPHSSNSKPRRGELSRTCHSLPPELRA